MRVSLPMYDLHEFVEDHERLWTALAGALKRTGIDHVPDSLEWPKDLFEAWQSPDLFLSQTCGLPLVRELAASVQLVGVPHYGAEGCDSYHYSSALVVAREAPYRSLADLRGKVAGFNERVSQSGYNTLRFTVAPLARDKRFFSRVVETGRHESSLDAILGGTIDVAAVDAVTLALFRRSRPERAAGLRVLGFTPAAPGLPLIANKATPQCVMARLRSALVWLFQAPELAALRARLMLTGISFPSLSVYQSIVAQARSAVELGYPEIS
jgi:ABC-type phosphate/phosphonate transport system substrate-binding protein